MPTFNLCVNKLCYVLRTVNASSLSYRNGREISCAFERIHVWNSQKLFHDPLREYEMLASAIVLYDFVDAIRSPQEYPLDGIESCII